VSLKVFKGWFVLKAFRGEKITKLSKVKQVLNCECSNGLVKVRKMSEFSLANS